MTAKDDRIRKDLKKKGLGDLVPKFDAICQEMEEFLAELKRREA